MSNNKTERSRAKKQIPEAKHYEAVVEDKVSPGLADRTEAIIRQFATLDLERCVARMHEHQRELKAWFEKTYI